MKMTEEQVIEAVTMARLGKTVKQLSVYFGVKYSELAADFAKLRRLGVEIPFSPHLKKAKFDWASLVEKLK